MATTLLALLAAGASAVGSAAAAAGTAVGSAAGTVGSALGSAAGAVGTGLGQVGSAIGQGAQAVGHGLGEAAQAVGKTAGQVGQSVGHVFGGGGGAAPVNIGGSYLGGGTAQGPLGLGAHGAAGINLGGPVLQGGGSAVNVGPMAFWGGLNAGGSPSGFEQIMGLYSKYGKYAQMLSGGQQGAQKRGLAEPEPAAQGGLMRGQPTQYHGFDWIGAMPRRGGYSDLYDWRRYV